MINLPPLWLKLTYIVGTPLGKIVGKMAEKDKKMQPGESEKKEKTSTVIYFHGWCWAKSGVTGR